MIPPFYYFNRSAAHGAPRYGTTGCEYVGLACTRVTELIVLLYSIVVRLCSVTKPPTWPEEPERFRILDTNQEGMYLEDTTRLSSRQIVLHLVCGNLAYTLPALAAALCTQAIATTTWTNTRTIIDKQGGPHSSFGE